MASGLDRFRRLLISEPALATELGSRQMAAFRGASLPVTELPSDSAALAHEAAQRPGTLLVLRTPSKGWVTKADYGSLASRPGERHLHPIMGCQSACAYCYLRGMEVGLRPLRFHVDLQDLLSSIDREIATADHQPLLFCTGELADSLGDADLFPIAAELIRHIGRRRVAQLELRTKSNCVQSLVDCDHGGLTTVAFSLAPQQYIKRHEPGTASLQERLEAAREVQKLGYRLAFKFEPILIESDWKILYAELLEAIVGSVDIAPIDHVSVGCLRWSGPLSDTKIFAKQYAEEIAAGEWIQYRPDRKNGTIRKDDRLEIYRWMRIQLRRVGIRSPIWWSVEEKPILDLLNEDQMNP
ncbi:hypothetical protein GXW71_06505 [Roseomonas hellenica]|uniref:Spore photoproduct lyase n=1 Tax=Plastoroseomonas hellenica TaxID=2687306 RepID=A0ABS5EUN5_9PROT|nr:hypothetical protein [Plastoroseomonas hellenica]MBR0664004.1 hypothetical protein [Plastoroseomonas hellenica]